MKLTLIYMLLNEIFNDKLPKVNPKQLEKYINNILNKLKNDYNHSREYLSSTLLQET